MISEMVSAAATGDREKMKETAHKLKGSSLNIGAKAVADVCLELEKLADQETKDTLVAIVSDLKVIFENTIPVLRDSYEEG
jgi:HPt (histidine-containing phosphotransfer) domain-containing protein